ncbi:uncharacterized protein LOC119161710 isoform X2 [Rhipicephalus microplus]|uniref:uncharacterized protein LOC119161710 isoform X2 n=1 Tax=Rhipicephalus microplus TaxID=6941 RepID=UPI003F6BEF3A
MPGCCAYQCSSRSEKGVRLFYVPRGDRNRNAVRRKQWIHNIGRKDFAPSKHVVLCELHFTNDQFEPKVLEAHGLKKLKPNAIPTLFSHRPPPKERKPPSKRLEIRKKCSKKREESVLEHTTSKQGTFAENQCSSPASADPAGSASSAEVAEPEVNEVCENEVNQLVESPFEIVHDNSSHDRFSPEVSSNATQDIAAVDNACQEAIQGRIAELERLQEATARKLALARKRYLKSEEEKEEIKKRLKGLFNDDEMRSMERLSAQGARWEAGTLVKSLQLRLACGSRGYGLLREFGYPLPSDRTL